MNEVKIFNSEEFGDIRTVQLNNETYFVGKDVATALGYADTFGALKKHIMDEDNEELKVAIAEKMKLNERERDNLNDIYADEIITKRGARICGFSLEFVKDIELLKKINNKDVYEAVKVNLLNDKYYNVIFM